MGPWLFVRGILIWILSSISGHIYWSHNMANIKLMKSVARFHRSSWMLLLTTFSWNLQMLIRTLPLQLQMPKNLQQTRVVTGPAIIGATIFEPSHPCQVTVMYWKFGSLYHTLSSSVLTHWGLEKMAAISQMTFSNALKCLNVDCKFVPKDPFNNISTLVQVMAWRRPSNKPLSEPMMVSSLTHICVTRPQWVKC